MQPMGRKPLRFPRKVDYHPRPKRDWKNWWESEGQTENKTAERRAGKKEIINA